LAYEDLLSHHSQDPESVRRVWHKIPAEERQRPYLAVKAAGVFKEQGLDDAARALIARALEANWDDRLVRAYRQLAAEEGSPALLSQIELCENWEKKRPTDPELLLTLGALCLKQKLWGKAQRHLEQAVYYAVEPRMKQESHLKLAQLHEALNQPDEASLHYRESALAMLT
jgi:HemY protein